MRERGVADFAAGAAFDEIPDPQHSCAVLAGTSRARHDDMRAVLAKREPVVSDDEVRAMARRLWAAVPLTAVLVGMSLARVTLGRPLEPSWLPFVVVSPVALWCAWPLYHRAAASVARRRPDLYTLVGAGAATAFAFGVFDAGAALVTLVLVGRTIEAHVRDRLRAAAPILRAATVASARRVRGDGTDEEVAIGSVRVGDRVRIGPGEPIPVDGLVIEGFSAANESLLRGDPIPVTKRPGSLVAASTVNGTGSLVVRAEKVGAQTLASRVVLSIAAAQTSALPLQRHADRLARGLVELVPAIALVVFGAWMLCGPEPRWSNGVRVALAVVFVASPWALALTTPVSVLLALGRAASIGIVFGSAEAIETLRRADVLIIDKTGTLTEGKPRLVSVRPTVGFDKQQVLRLAASLERASRHPLAVAIVAAAEKEGLALSDVEEFEPIPGKGVTGVVGTRRLLLGNRALLDASGVTLDDLAQRAEPLRAQGQTVMFLAVNGVPAGLVSVADPVKPRTLEAMGMLHHEGVRVVLLTSDSSSTAQTLGRMVEADEIHAELLPEQKLEFVARLRARGHVVAMAGDGVNDGSALACADVAIAMSTGADIAVRNASVTLIEGDLLSIARARCLSHVTMTNAKQNLALAIVYNIAGLVGAAGALFPVTGFVPSPTLAATAMMLAAMAVLGNGLRLRRTRV